MMLRTINYVLSTLFGYKLIHNDVLLNTKYCLKHVLIWECERLLNDDRDEIIDTITDLERL